METGIHSVETGGQENVAVEILELYEKANETARLDMYMTHRDLREKFDRIEIL